ncbi:hypothetical protein DPEC_G00319660 [Dallia pectoralis]|uniref:Uncharacterized protein n=1 Tax=Dallia pectoralis TaxID=75939 RepID=A0ACC2F9Q8_DALPE|nr:hypothetical protein DPEC_G00319660 [Dallia pectoralis]
MAVAWLVREVSTLADQLDRNLISPTKARDRVEQLVDIIAEHSAISGTDVDELVFTKLRQVTERLSDIPRSNAGRPALDIPTEVIETYLLTGLKVKEIAKLYGVSQKTIHRRMQQQGWRASDLYANITDTELDNTVSDIHRAHPQTGYRMMKAFLQERGLRVQVSRVRESLRRVDPNGTELRAVCNAPLQRRQCSVPSCIGDRNKDGHHKLTSNS